MAIYRGIGTTDIASDKSVSRDYFTATEGQTLFALSNITYTIGNNSIMVFLNGVKMNNKDALDNLLDYEETSTSSITFQFGLNAGDIVEVIQHS